MCGTWYFTHEIRLVAPREVSPNNDQIMTSDCLLTQPLGQCSLPHVVTPLTCIPNGSNECWRSRYFAADLAKTQNKSSIVLIPIQQQKQKIPHRHPEIINKYVLKIHKCSGSTEPIFSNSKSILVYRYLINVDGHKTCYGYCAESRL